MMLGKLDNHMQKNEIGPLPYTTHKNELNMDERLKHNTPNHQILEENRKRKSSLTRSWQ